MALMDFVGGLSAAYDGYVKGRDAAVEAQERQDQIGFNKQVRASQAALLPAQSEAASAELAARTVKAKNELELAPQSQKVASGELAAKQFEQERAAAQQTHTLITDAFKRNMDGAQLVDAVTAKAGEYLSQGDMAGLKGVLGYSFSTDMLPEMKKLGAIASVGKTTVPEGATTLGGVPIEGEAVKVNFASGNVGYLDPKVMLEKYKRQLDEADRKGGFTLKDGEVRFGAGGRVLAATGDKPIPVGASQRLVDKNGKVIVDAMPQTGGAAGAAGKIDNPIDSAMKLLDKTLTDVGEKVATPADRARAQNYLGTVMRANPNVSADTAVLVAVDALTNPAAISPSIDKSSGLVNLIYRNRKIIGDRTLTLSQDAMSIDDLATKMDQKLVIKEVAAALDAQKPENRAAYLAAASSPEKLKELVDTIQAIPYPQTPEGAAARQQVMDKAMRMVDLAAKFGPKAPASTGPSAPAAAPVAPTAEDFRPKGIEDRNRAAAEARARMEKAAADKKAALEASARTAPERAKKLLESGDIQALSEFQSGPDFAKLDRATRMAIFNRVNGIKQ